MPESGQLFFFFPEGQEVMLLDAVTLVTALAALAGLVAAVAAPVLRLNSAITRLSTLIDRALRDMEALKERDEELRRSAKESHERLHSRIDRAGDRLQDHESRADHTGDKRGGRQVKLNWKVRVKNKGFWLALIPAALLLVQAVGQVFGLSLELSALGDQLLGVVNALFAVLAILGVVNDPTTQGLSDSGQAMTYDSPKGEGGVTVAVKGGGPFRDERRRGLSGAEKRGGTVRHPPAADMAAILPIRTTSASRRTWRRPGPPGCPGGCYLYSYAVDRDMARSEAAHTLRLLGGRKPPYGVWYDVEDPSQAGADLVGICEAYCGAVEAAGLYVGDLLHGVLAQREAEQLPPGPVRQVGGPVEQHLRLPEALRDMAVHRPVVHRRETF